MGNITIGLLGCGTVGTGVAELLVENQQLLADRLGTGLTLKYAADLDIEKDRGIAFAPGVLTTDAHKVVDDPQVDIIVELMGGTTFAKEMILRALANGKPVVTANKALLALDGEEVFRMAAQKGLDLAYEAAVGGCMPIIKSFRESLVGNRIRSFYGILNGTCNYILSKISADGSQFKDALAQAQSHGYAEADPTLDVEGQDTAHKLAILASLAYGTQVCFDDLYIEGISSITPLDIEFAKQFGYRIKLLAISKNLGDVVEARVHPTMIPENHPLAGVTGTMNAVTISGDAVGEMMLYGHGAGMLPTASAVLGDIVDVARNLLLDTPMRVPLRAFQNSCIEGRIIPVLPIENIETNYYLRFSVLDRPGVLSKISGVIGDHHISIQSVHQKGRKTSGSVPIVMLTHRASEASVRKALTDIESLKVASEPMLIRIESDNQED